MFDLRLQIIVSTLFLTDQSAPAGWYEAIEKPVFDVKSLVKTISGERQILSQILREETRQRASSTGEILEAKSTEI